jgi:hypothetical protein
LSWRGPAWSYRIRVDSYTACIQEPRLEHQPIFIALKHEFLTWPKILCFLDKLPGTRLDVQAVLETERQAYVTLKKEDGFDSMSFASHCHLYKKDMQLNRINMVERILDLTLAEMTDY